MVVMVLQTTVIMLELVKALPPESLANPQVGYMPVAVVEDVVMEGLLVDMVEPEVEVMDLVVGILLEIESMLLQVNRILEVAVEVGVMEFVGQVMVVRV